MDSVSRFFEKLVTLSYSWVVFRDNPDRPVFEFEELAKAAFLALADD